MKFVQTLIFLAASFLVPSALAEPVPLVKRAYSPELKASLARIDEHWKNIEKQITSVPTTGATVQDFRVAKLAMDNLSDYMETGYQVAIERNGPFTNVKWSDEFLKDMRPYQGNGANAMKTLRSQILQINATGGIALVLEIQASNTRLGGWFTTMEGYLGRYIFQFLGGFSLLSPIKDEFHMLDEIYDTGKAFSRFYCHYIWDPWGASCDS